MTISNQEQQPVNTQNSDRLLLLPLHALDAGQVPLVGGKAANLGELIHAGLPVPEGFCLTTAAYDLVAQQADLPALLEAFVATVPDDLSNRERYAAETRQRLSAVSLPASLTEAIRDAYNTLSAPSLLPLAVRSSATAEDLPFASFAGQQETILNVITFEALLDAIKRCWASLWTDRAVSYRTSNGIDQRSVRLAVVVQRLVPASVAGVLFTANPLTGRRRQAVIDANPGLGEAVVSGAVNPDHFVVNTSSGEIIERRLGEKRSFVRALPGGGTEQQTLADGYDTSCLTDEQITALSRLGSRVEAHFRAPQDIEWAIDEAGTIWLTQARPITTLYPLPANAPDSENNLRIYFSLNVAQGVYRPFTPMGMAMARLIVSTVARTLGGPQRQPRSDPSFMLDAGYRIFLDTTAMFRSPVWRPPLFQLMNHMEARSLPILRSLASDPRLAPIPTSRWRTIRTLLPLLLRTRGLPFAFLVQALLKPSATRARLDRLQDRMRALNTAPAANASPDELLADLEQSLATLFPTILVSVMPLVGLIFGLPALTKRLLKGQANDEELQVVRRGLPYNPTTEMSLSLWELAAQLRQEPSIIQLFQHEQPEQLAQSYRAGTLPEPLQQGLANFLRLYGHRAVAEIDVGIPRWSEDPTYVLGMLANYMALHDPEAAPDVQFHRSVQEAEAMVKTLTRRARKLGWLRGKLVAFCLSRIRQLAGLREVPKFNFVLALAAMRSCLLAVGADLVRADRLENAEDVFFLTLTEVREALAGRDFRPLVCERSADYQREMGRRHIPRILLSDGTEPEAALSAAPAGAKEPGEQTLTGAPASAGIVTGKARVILDPAGARLEAGEILVAPSTDPGWTPLFFTASGLVMEMGGPMSHGAIVAREYGIPAVVGVSGALEHITTGQQITVDGSRGVITLS